jgi:hypothetical protein
MFNALSQDRRRQFDRVVLVPAITIDRRQQWRDRMADHESMKVREQYIAQSANQRKQA